MSEEPRPWLEDGASSFELELLASARVDRPSSRALPRTLAAVSATLIGATTTAAAAGTPAAIGLVGVLKWVGVGVLGGLATMVAVETVNPKPSAGPGRSVGNQPSSVAIVGRIPTHGESPRSAEPVVRSTQPSRSARTPELESESETAPQSSVSATVPNPRKTQDLARETSLVSQASRQVEAGDPTRALALLDQWAHEYPNGVLRPEAAVVRVRALVQAGRRQEAQALAASHTSSEPGSAPARAMQHALDEPPPTK